MTIFELILIILCFVLIGNEKNIMIKEYKDDMARLERKEKRLLKELSKLND